MYLFNESIPTVNQVINTLHIITDNEFTVNEAMYIRHLSKELFFNTTKDTMNKLVELTEKLKKEHHWELNFDLFEGVLTSIILFPPWYKNVLKNYPNPLIVNATFSRENIRFTSCVIIDGELHTQLIKIVIRGTEDSKGYRYIFDFTIISDMAPCIEKACKDSFGDKYSLIYCLFHLKKICLKNIPELKGKKFTYYKHLFLPCNAGGHWVLLDVNLKAETVGTYDSYNTPCSAEVHTIQKFFEFADVLKYPSKLTKKKITCPQQQHRTRDCGVFVLENLRNLLHEGADEKGKSRYDMHCIPEIRLRISSELYQKNLVEDYEYKVDPNYPPPPQNP